MRYLRILTLILLGWLLSSTSLPAQSEGEERFLPVGAYKVMGFNTTPLLVQLIPFNRSDPRVVGPHYVHWRSYIAKGDKLKGFKISLGLDLSDISEESVQAFANLRLGFEGYRRISSRWGYTRGFSLMFGGGDFNTPGTKGEDDPILGFGPHWGVDFFVSPKVSLSLETALIFGGDSFGPTLGFVPPVALNLNFWSPKRDRN